MGDSADEQACAGLRDRGYSVPTDHRVAVVGPEHLGADLVVAFGPEHVAVLRRHRVGVDRLMYVEVPNPIFAADFEFACTAIEDAMPRLHEWLDERLIAPGRGLLETAVGSRFWTGLPGDALRSPYQCEISWPTKWGMVEPPWSYLVVGKVLLFDVLTFRPPPTMKISPRAEYRARLGGIVELGLLDTDGGSDVVACSQELSDRYGVEVLDISNRGQLDELTRDAQ